MAEVLAGISSIAGPVLGAGSAAATVAQSVQSSRPSIDAARPGSRTGADPRTAQAAQSQRSRATGRGRASTILTSGTGGGLKTLLGQ